MLRRFAAYLEKVFDFGALVSGLRDGRQQGQIPTQTIWLSVFTMFALRLGSFNALEQELRRPRRWAAVVGMRRPSADTLGRVLGSFSLETVRQLVVQIHRSAWRNKAIHFDGWGGNRVVAIDGHELFSSRARCCPDCLVREVEVRGGKVKEYYHRVVVAQWVGVTPPGILDVELLKPGEGEVVAARRLFERIVKNYERLVDVICADALYLEAPFIRLVLEAGKHVVVVIKQEARELYQDADRLRSLEQPQVVEDQQRTTRLWDLGELESFTTLGRPVRVVWAEESTQQNQFKGGQRQALELSKTWAWVTDLPAAVVPALLIQRWGHARWDLENRGFNELVTHWWMDHCFVHQTTAMAVLLLTLAAAFSATYLFYERNLKPAVRQRITRLALASQLFEGLGFLDGSTLWSQRPRDG